MNCLFWTIVISVNKTKQRHITLEANITIEIPYFYPKIIVDLRDKQRHKKINHIYADHCFKIPIEKFCYFCNQVWKTKKVFVTVDLASSKEKGKFRKNLSIFYIPNKVQAIDQYLIPRKTANK